MVHMYASVGKIDSNYSSVTDWSDKFLAGSASAIIGGVVSQLVAGKAQAGASTAASGTKNNFYQRLTSFKKIIEKIKENYL